MIFRIVDFVNYLLLVATKKPRGMRGFDRESKISG